MYLLIKELSLGLGSLCLLLRTVFGFIRFMLIKFMSKGTTSGLNAEAAVFGIINSWVERMAIVLRSRRRGAHVEVYMR